MYMRSGTGTDNGMDVQAVPPSGLAGWLLACFDRRKSQLRRKHMLVLETLALGSKRQLTLVECDGRRYLLGGGADSVETIVALADDSPAALPVPGSAPLDTTATTAFTSPTAGSALLAHQAAPPAREQIAPVVKVETDAIRPPSVVAEEILEALRSMRSQQHDEFANRGNSEPPGRSSGANQLGPLESMQSPLRDDPAEDSGSVIKRLAEMSRTVPSPSPAPSPAPSSAQSPLQAFRASDSAPLERISPFPNSIGEPYGETELLSGNQFSREVLLQDNISRIRVAVRDAALRMEQPPCVEEVRLSPRARRHAALTASDQFSPSDAVPSIASAEVPAAMLHATQRSPRFTIREWA